MQIHHVALRVQDCERARAFYGEILGLSEVKRDMKGSALRSVWLSAGDTLLMLETRLRGTGGETGTGHVLAFEVRDLEEWALRLERAGIELRDRTDFTLYVTDPDGHRVGLTVFPGPKA